MKNKNSIFQIYEILEFVPLLEKKWQFSFNVSSITN
jgi:hypothetical protein